MTSLSTVSASANTWTDLTGGMTAGRTYVITFSPAELYDVCESAGTPTASTSHLTWRRYERPAYVFDGTNLIRGRATEAGAFHIQEVV